MYAKKRKRCISKKNARRLLVVAFVAIVIVAIVKFCNEHFYFNTYINGVNCSFLTVDKAAEKIQQNLNDRVIAIKVNETQSYFVTGDSFGLRITDFEELAHFLESQKKGSYNLKYEYTLVETVKVDTDKIRCYLSSIDELQIKNMIWPKDAHLQQGEDGFLSIVPEVYGNWIDLENATSYCATQIKANEQFVDLSFIAHVEPSIFYDNEELNEKKDTINSILSTSIIFRLCDGSVDILDNTVMKNWIYTDKAGQYYINVKKGVTDFVWAQWEKLNEINGKIIFNPTGLENPVIISLREDQRLILNVDEEIRQIQELLKTPGSYVMEPVYFNPLNLDDILNFIEIDIRRQTVWMYYNGECIVETKCVTGNLSKGYDTPLGIFHLVEKATDATLMENSHANYWMLFYDGCGLHDALWRSEFGGDIYKSNGSHGCVNLPLDAAKTIYKYAEINMLIIIYFS